MPSAEIELKFPVSNPAELQQRLPNLGFHLETTRTFEHNTLFDTPDRQLRGRHQLLRLRRYGTRCTLTHKRTPEDADDSRYKTRIETESTVGDCDALATVFAHLGYTPAFVYEKFRTEWSFALPESGATAHLVVDETPIGTWAELEGPTGWIDRMLLELAVDTRTCLTESYGKLFLAWKERTGSPAQNLTFAEATTPALAAH